MPTTTIRLEADLKVRVAAAAERAGKTSHAFILDAIAQTVEQTEVESAFDHLADERWATLLKSGRTIAWDDAKPYLQARARGERARKPAPRKTRR
jgi:predicted transcriptional regulator